MYVTIFCKLICMPSKREKSLVKISSDFSRPFVIICTIVTIIIFGFSLWVSLFTYEPQSSESVFYRPIYVFFMIFVPTISIVISGIYFIKIIVDLIQKKYGSKFKLFMIFVFVVIVVIPSLIVAHISVNVIAYNTNIWTVANIDSGLEMLVRSFDDRLTIRKQTMEYRISNAGDDGIFAQLALEINEEDTEHMMLANRNIDNMFVFDATLTNQLFARGIEPVISISGFTNTNIMFVESQYSNSFFITAVIPVLGASNEVFAYSIWTEEMESDFVVDRNSSMDILRLYRTISLFSDEFDRLLDLFYLFVIGISAFITIIVGFLISKLILDPILYLSEMTEVVAENDFDTRVTPRGLSEMRMLINRFNIMIASLKDYVEMQNYTQKLVAWRDVALKLAHEIKNPLTPIMMNADFISHIVNKSDMKEKDKERINTSIMIVMKNVTNIEYLINSFSQFSFETKFSEEPISINECIVETLSHFQFHKDVDFNISYDEKDFSIIMDRKKLVIAFTNIIKNALEAIEPSRRGRITVVSRYKREASDNVGQDNDDSNMDNDNNYFVVSIADNGVGISASLINSIFEPYYTSKEKGTGLGLSLVEKIIKEHNGFIEVQSEENIGTTFFIHFNTSEKEAIEPTDITT